MFNYCKISDVRVKFLINSKLQLTEIIALKVTHLKGSSSSVPAYPYHWRKCYRSEPQSQLYRFCHVVIPLRKSTYGTVMASVHGACRWIQRPNRTCTLCSYMSSISQWINCCSAVGSLITHQPALAKRRKRGGLSPMSVNTTELAQLQNNRRWTVFIRETNARRPKGAGFHAVILAGFSYPSCTNLKWENYVNSYLFKAILAEVCSDYIKKN